MIYLVDGYNLIGAMQGIQLSSQTKEYDLRAFINRYYSQSHYYFIVFDGNDVRTIKEKYDTSTIIFTPSYQSADHYLVSLSQEIRDCTAVTTDRALQKQLKKHCQRVIDCHLFLKLRRKQVQPAEKPSKSYTAETAWLMQCWGYNG